MAGLLIGGITAVVLMTAQVDLDTTYTRNAGDIARTNIGNRAVDRAVRRQSGAATMSRTEREAKNVCAQRAQLRARHGAEDPRVRRLERLCAAHGL